ncbi:MAG: endonuclease III [Synergistaceae bacterium]|nr:endonuclease III [Synergistaceae bacterium]
MSRMTTLEHITMVLDRLDSLYGHESSPPGMYSTGEPLDGLILTLLSQNTNDRNRDIAYESLREKFPSWGDTEPASASDIAVAIKSAGLGDTKAVRMKAILARIKNDFGEYSLAEMKEWDAPRVKEYLSNLHGIGPKTVACVMVFDLGLPAFPVDTHIARISGRLGWVQSKTAPERIQVFLESVIPPDRCSGGHLNMIEHGRRTCHARGAKCAECALSGICPSNGARENRTL